MSPGGFGPFTTRLSGGITKLGMSHPPYDAVMTDTCGISTHPVSHLVRKDQLLDGFLRW